MLTVEISGLVFCFGSWSLLGYNYRAMIWLASLHPYQVVGLILGLFVGLQSMTFNRLIGAFGKRGANDKKRVRIPGTFGI